MGPPLRALVRFETVGELPPAPSERIRRIFPTVCKSSDFPAAQLLRGYSTESGHTDVCRDLRMSRYLFPTSFPPLFLSS